MIFMTNKIKVKEIFSSIQGEGPFIGYKQLFIRFCGCNLNCNYCDTDFDTEKSNTYSTEELLNIVEKNKDCHSISLTGGEPLLHTEFLKEFLPKCTLPIYLETNATLTEKLSEIIEFVEYVSADIKLPSCTGLPNLWEVHDKFFEVAKSKKLFAKVVFDDKITDFEINSVINLVKKYQIETILQPKMNGNDLSVNNKFIEFTLDKFLAKYNKVRLIPQVHKFLDVR